MNQDQIKELPPVDIKDQLRTGAEFYQAFGDITLANTFTQAADHIATLEQEVKHLHISLAGAVQHGIEGWNRYESANRMCKVHQDDVEKLSRIIFNPSTQSTDQQNVSINGGKIDVSREVG